MINSSSFPKVRSHALAPMATGLLALLAGCTSNPAGDIAREAQDVPKTIAAAPMTTPGRWCDRLPRPAVANLTRVQVGQDWFEVYEVADGVFAINEPFQFQEVISYLILGQREALLFDTGMGIGRMRDLVEELTSLPVSVLNSHSHFDHVGANAEFDFVYAMDTAFTLKRSRGSTREAVRDEVAVDALCRELPDGRSSGDYSIRPYNIDASVADGATLDLGDRVLEVLHIPGHTPDSIALLDASNGLLWTGDSYYPGPVWLFVPETDLDAYQASVSRLASLAPDLKLLLPAHNEPVAEPQRLVELAAAVASIRRGEAEPARREGERLEYDFGGFSVIVRADLLESE